MSKVVFITGISSGFGKHTASLLAEKGHKVYGTCRRESEHDSKVNVLYMDVTDKAAVEICIKTVIEKEGRIDVLINNAGMHVGGPVEITPYENIQLQMDTNFMGVVHTIRAVLPFMRKQGNGRIINISSMNGLLSTPFVGFYCASKFAVEGLSESLRMELKPFNIQLILVNPGDFHTQNTANRKNIYTLEGNNAYETQSKKSLAVIEKDENSGWHPDILARKIVKIVDSKNPHNRYVVGSFEQKLAVVLKYILPGSWFAKIIESHYGIKA
ncbi:MAG: SDR family oxidoreductase [Bacteroidales bacterium]